MWPAPIRSRSCVPLAEMEEEGLPIHKAYLVSCVNSRLEDLEAAAAVIRGRKVAEGVELYVAAASAEVQEAAEESGAWSALVEAGARVLPPGCGPCIGLGTGPSGGRRGGDQRHKPEFQGQNGIPACPGLPGQPGSGGGLGGCRPGHGPGPALSIEAG